MLRDMGICDQPVQIINLTGNPLLTLPSLYDWAKFDYRKNMPVGDTVSR